MLTHFGVIAKFCGRCFRRSYGRSTMCRRPERSRDNVVQRRWNSSSLEHIWRNLYSNLWYANDGHSRCCLASWHRRLCHLCSWSYAANLARADAETDCCVTGAIPATGLRLVRWRSGHQHMVRCSYTTSQFAQAHIIILIIIIYLHISFLGRNLRVGDWFHVVINNLWRS